MSVSDFILSVDIGTSATKAILFDTDVKQIAIVRKPYPIHAPHKGWSEQEPEVIFDAVLGALQEIAQSVPEGSRVLGVSFSSQLYSVLAVDANGKALTNSLTWSDTRSAEIAQLFSQHRKLRGSTREPGVPLMPYTPWPRFSGLGKMSNCQRVKSSSPSRNM